MTDEQREELKRLAIAASHAERRLHFAGYQSMPDDTDKAAEQAANYALLGAEAVETRVALQAAIAVLGKPAEPWVRGLAAEMMEAARLAAGLRSKPSPIQTEPPWGQPGLYDHGENNIPLSRRVRQFISRGHRKNG